MAAVCIGVKLTAYIAAMAIIATRLEPARVAQHLIEFCFFIIKATAIGLAEAACRNGLAADVGV